MKPANYESKLGFANIAQIIHGTQAEGPGIRTAIWFQGCSILCKNCCNPSFLPFKDNKWMKHESIIQELIDYKKANKLDGVTFIGGEPFDQPISLSILCRMIKEINLNIMIFSGNKLEELRARNDANINSILSNTDILVDGMYDDTKRTEDIRWVGSTNQTMHFLTDAYNKDDPQFKERNTVEYRIMGNEMIANGWPVNGRKSPFVSVENLTKK